MKSWFPAFARTTSNLAGSPIAFALAVAVVVGWAVTGPVFGFSDTWQLVINTGTTIVTFLMVFLIQSSQNRDTQALQLKLDELIRATSSAHNLMMDLERLDDDQIEKLRQEYEKLARNERRNDNPHDQKENTPKARRNRDRRRSDRLANPSNGQS